jgi:predicted DNA-binding ribbon-helix-helix protein
MLTKRVHLLLTETHWQELSNIAMRQQRTVARLIREAIVQTYHLQGLAGEKSTKLQMIEEMSQMNLPVADWQVMEQEATNRYESLYNK